MSGLRGVRWRLIGAVVAKDLAVVRRSRMILSTITILPALFAVVLPLIALLIPTFAGSASLAHQLAQLPRPLRALFAGHSPGETWVLYASLYMFAPFFLMIPLMSATGFAADSIAGERERKTLEGLLFTPLSDLELYAAKVLGAWLTAMVVTGIAFVVYALTVNLAAWPIMGRIFFPTTAWLLLMVLVVPAAAALGLGVIVLISARVATTYEAFQMGGMVVLPVVLLLFGQVSGVLIFGPLVVLVLGIVAWALALGVLYAGLARFKRPELLNRV